MVSNGLAQPTGQKLLAIGSAGMKYTLVQNPSEMVQSPQILATANQSVSNVVVGNQFIQSSGSNPNSMVLTRVIPNQKFGDLGASNVAFASTQQAVGSFVGGFVSPQMEVGSYRTVGQSSSNASLSNNYPGTPSPAIESSNYAQVQQNPIYIQQGHNRMQPIQSHAQQQLNNSQREPIYSQQGQNHSQQILSYNQQAPNQIQRDPNSIQQETNYSHSISSPGSSSSGGQQVEFLTAMDIRRNARGQKFAVVRHKTKEIELEIPEKFSNVEEFSIGVSSYMKGGKKIRKYGVYSRANDGE